MGKLKNEFMAQVMDDMGEPTLEKEAFDAMFGADPLISFDAMAQEAGITLREPTAYEVEQSHYEHWLWELTKYDDIHLIRELEERGFEVKKV